MNPFSKLFYINNQHYILQFILCISVKLYQIYMYNTVYTVFEYFESKIFMYFTLEKTNCMDKLEGFYKQSLPVTKVCINLLTYLVQ